jgi:hypothetical protein
MLPCAVSLDTLLLSNPAEFPPSNCAGGAHVAVFAMCAIAGCNNVSPPGGAHVAVFAMCAIAGCNNVSPPGGAHVTVFAMCAGLAQTSPLDVCGPRCARHPMIQQK